MKILSKIKCKSCFNRISLIIDKTVKHYEKTGEILNHFFSKFVFCEECGQELCASYNQININCCLGMHELGRTEPVLPSLEKCFELSHKKKTITIDIYGKDTMVSYEAISPLGYLPELKAIQRCKNCGYERVI